MQDCDFIPTRYREAGRLKAAIKLRASGIAVMVSLMVLWVVVHQQRLQTAKADVSGVDEQQEQIAIHLAQKCSMEAERADLLGHQMLLEQLQGNSSLVVLLSDISRRMPEAVVLTRVSAECDRLSLYGVDADHGVELKRPTAPNRRRDLSSVSRLRQPPTERVSLTGIARTIPEIIEFAAGLESSPLLESVRMEMQGPATWAGYRVQQFELTCVLAQQLGDGR